MIKLSNILREWKGDEQTTQVVAIMPEEYQGQINWTNYLQRNKSLTVSKHTYPSDNMLSAAKTLAAESDNATLAIVQLIANKQPLKAKITSVDALKNICDRKDIQLVLIGPEPESFKTKPSADYQQFMKWLSSSGLQVIDLSDLTNPSYYDESTNDLNKQGNRIIVKRIAATIALQNPTLAASIESEDSEDSEDQEKNTEKQAAGKVKPDGDIAKNPVVIAPGGAMYIPISNRRRTGEATDWETVMDFLIEKGLSQAGAAGVAGNMRIESNFKPDVYGDKGTSVGICQWHATRMQALFNFAENLGAEPLAVDTQLHYLWHELTKSYSGLLAKLKTATDPATAAYDFASIFERPAHISQSRMEYAREYYENYTTNKGSDDENDKNSDWLGNSLQAITGAIGLGTMSTLKAPKTNAKNGQMSSSELKSVGGGHSLAFGAADAFLAMKAAAAEEGVDIKLSDSYRPLSVQNAIFDWDWYKQTGKNRKKGTTYAAAYPGTSNHGLGRAIDVSGKAAQDWIRKNGEAYGWSWAEGRSVGEPWHFTYVK